MTDAFDSDSIATLRFDGASRGNPGPASIGWDIIDDGNVLAEGSDGIGHTTNNCAEYEALIAGIERARELGIDQLHAKGDSQLIVKQVQGEWNVNDSKMRERWSQVQSLSQEFDEFEISHVPREENERADELANEAFARQM